jgi:hypothetical protein
LTHTIAPGRDSFFNFTEGEPVGLAAGVTYNAVTKVVSINLTGVKAGDAKLVFRLVNDDADTTTLVKIRDIALVDAPIGTLAPVQTSLGSAEGLPDPIALTSFNAMTDISSSVQADYQKTSFNAKTGILYTDVALHSVGSYSVDAPLIAIIRVDDPRISVRNADGYTPEGLPYFNYSSLVVDRKLEPNEQSAGRSVAFYNPTQLQFSYQVQILAQLNQRPVITSQPVVEVLQGKKYEYAVKATDPNGDALAYKLLSAPAGMSLNAQSGLLTWDSAGVSLGNQTVLIHSPSAYSVARFI